MTDAQKTALAERLATAAPAPISGPPADLSAALERMIGAGAARFGLRADATGPADACALAPRV